MGMLIRQLRESQKLSAKDLAAMVGCTRAAITSIELGKTRLPAPEIVRGLSAALDVSQSELLVAAGYLDRSEVDPSARLDQLRKAEGDLGKALEAAQQVYRRLQAAHDHLSAQYQRTSSARP